MTKPELKSAISKALTQYPFPTDVDEWVDHETGKEKLVVYAQVPVDSLDTDENIQVYRKYDRMITDLLSGLYAVAQTPIAVELELVA